MHGLRIALALVALSSIARADGPTIGGFIGPRIFADDAQLGFLANAPAHPDLGFSIMFGGRLSYPLANWLIPEFELALSPTSTNAEGGASSTNVFWLDPRIHMRFQLSPDERLQPFLLIGGGGPIAISSARQTFDSGIVWEGYIGGGVRFDTFKGFVIRGDARIAIVPGARMISDNQDDPYIAPEFDIHLGIELTFGGKKKSATKEGPLPDSDDDKDGVANANDKCVDRAEDHDGFDDQDGCPDIDNDTDRVLDIADKCATVPENFNGFQDDDGCPDTVPPEVDGLRGTIEGLLYAEAETAVRDSAVANIKKIAAVMTAHASIRVVLIGHTDDREAKQFSTGGSAEDIAEVAVDLSKARAEAVRQVLAANGIIDSRVVVEGKGSQEPVAENAKPKGRLANRRVEIKLYVPPR